MIKNILKELIVFIFHIIFSLFDSFIWLLIKLLPKQKVLLILRYRVFKNIKLGLKQNIKKKIKKFFIKIISYRCKYARLASSCLSRCITGRIFLDLIDVENIINIGIIKSEDNEKIPHAWLKDVVSSKNLTPGIKKSNGIYLDSF